MATDTKTYKSPGICTLLIVIAALTILGSIFLLLGSQVIGVSTVITSVGGIITALIIVAFAILIESTDRTQKDIARLVDHLTAPKP